MNYKCCKCNNFAKRMYMPDDGEDNEIKNDFFCENHVPRGCSCNEEDVIIYYELEKVENLPDEDTIKDVDWQWITENRRWEHLDNGKQLPCCEYLYSEEGFEKEINYDL